MKTPEHILERNRERRRQREQRRKDEMWQRIHVRQRQRDETERQHLEAILKEHQRGTPRETALALAWTVYELRGNFERLGGTIGDVLGGKGFIGLWPYGPYREEHFQRVIAGEKAATR